jgi:hypothetical protein
MDVLLFFLLCQHIKRMDLVIPLQDVKNLIFPKSLSTSSAFPFSFRLFLMECFYCEPKLGFKRLYMKNPRR